jgi:phosphoribosyl 1,2-cyclic phosphodiesterase
MFSFTVLGSGSAGNCAVVESDECKLLVDGGLSAKQMTLRLAEAGIQPGELTGILLTHEHVDHIGGLEVFCKKFATPIYCNPGTAEALARSREACQKNFRLFQTGSEFAIKDITVQTFSVPHDAADPIGFVLHHNSTSLGFCTDLGFATKLVFERLRNVQALIIETNHDEKLLQEDAHRPWAVKQRIMSRHGHLSNSAAAEVLVHLLEESCVLRRAVLGHLSRDCNRPELALETVRARLADAGSGFEVFCASQKQISPRFEL